MITVTLPAPLSLNNAYRGRRYLTPEARDYKADVDIATIAALHESPQTFDPDAIYAAEMVCYFPDNRRRDLDNLFKVAADSICDRLKIDDSRIHDIRIRRRASYTGSAWAEFTLRVLED